MRSDARPEREDRRAAAKLLGRRAAVSWTCTRVVRRRPLSNSLPPTERWTVRRSGDPVVRVDLGPADDGLRVGVAVRAGFRVLLHLSRTPDGPQLVTTPTRAMPAAALLHVRAAVRRLVDDAEVLGRWSPGGQLSLFGSGR